MDHYLFPVYLQKKKKRQLVNIVVAGTRISPTRPFFDGDEGGEMDTIFFSPKKEP